MTDEQLTFADCIEKRKVEEDCVEYTACPSCGFLFYEDWPEKAFGKTYHCEYCGLDFVASWAVFTSWIEFRTILEEDK